MAKEGEAAPGAAWINADGGKGSVADHKGSKLVVYFYPKDDTTGCTNEAKDFTALLGEFAKAGTDVVGISKDSVKKHASLIAKHDLKVALVADVEGTLCEAYGAWVEKSLYGRKYMGIERCTFLIGRHGKVAKIWRKGKLAGHPDAVRAAAKALP